MSIENTELVIRDNLDTLVSEAGELFISIGQASVSKRGRFFVALSGGATPRPLHKLFAQRPYVDNILWRSTHLFWVDERCVPVDDPASNFGAAKLDFVNQLPIPQEQIHPMSGAVPPEEGAASYEKLLVHVFDSELPAFDLIMLGVGKDGHVASLFPGQSTKNIDNRLVVPVIGGYPELQRLTMTFPILNNSRHVVFLVSGKSKAPVVKAIVDKQDTSLPGYWVQPKTGKLTWVLDAAAASMLDRCAKQA